MTQRKPFWQRKSLREMTTPEWESLCDGCARCCLNKLEYEDTGEVAYTCVACHLLDEKSCRCTRYAERQRLVPGCIILTPDNIEKLHWMPSTCAYRLLFEGKDLPWWHPLVSGRAETVEEAGIAVRGKIISERHAGDLEEYIVTWPE